MNRERRLRLHIFLFLAIAALAHADERTRKLAARLPEEAALFLSEAVKVVGQEKLQQHAVKEESEERPGVNKYTWQDRQVISQYSFISFRESPETLREMRQVESIDGKQVKSEKALRAVAAAVTSSDERQKRKMLEDFEKSGLVGVATDLGQLLLLFSGRKIQNYDFSFQSQRFVGADPVLIFTYAQTTGGGMTVYRGTDTMRPKLSGEIWVNGEYRPLKITLNSVAESAVDKKTIRQEIEVTYSPSFIPCVLPTRAHHRELHNSLLHAENDYEYSDFHPWEEARK